MVIITFAKSDLSKRTITSTIKNWWLFLIYGVLMIAFSIWVWLTPLESYGGLSLQDYLELENNCTKLYNL